MASPIRSIVGSCRSFSKERGVTGFVAFLVRVIVGRWRSLYLFITCFGRCSSKQEEDALMLPKS
jgi:hypothetical protein